METIIATAKQVQQYYNTDALNQSKLKGLLSTKKLTDDENRSFVLGSGVDIRLTGNPEDFDNTFYISTIDKKPSDVVMIILKKLYTNLIELEAEYSPLVNHEDMLGEILNNTDWYNNRTVNSRRKILYEQAEYFEELFASNGKQILSTEEYNLILEIEGNFRNDPNMKRCFRDDDFTISEGTEVTIYYQYPIYFKYRDIDCKALLDIVIVVVKDGVMRILPIDIKTMAGKTISFLYSLRRFRYDIQAAFYTEALKFRFPNAIISDFNFFVESTTNPGIPLVYQLTGTLLSIGKYGRDSVRVSKTGKLKDPWPIAVKGIKGFDELVDEYIFYEQNGYEKEKIVVESNGVLAIDWDEILTS